MSDRVLVTGAAGFVGSHLLELLERDDVEILAWKRPGTEPLVVGTRVSWATIELQDRDVVRRAIAEARPASVYHLAGVPHVGDSWSHTRETFEGNVLATHHLLEGLRHAGLTPRVLVTSSATVYTPAPRALREDDAVCPNNPYGTSKLAQEMLLQNVTEHDGIPGLIARSFNHVGPRQSPAFVAASIAKQVALIEAGQHAPVLAMGNLEPARDIMDVRDTVRAYRAMMHSAVPGRPYNVCYGRAIPIRELVDRFLAHAKVKIAITQDPARFRQNDTPLVLGDASRLKADTGWSPEIPIDQTVRDLLDYWRAQSG